MADLCQNASMWALRRRAGLLGMPAFNQGV
jgi:hypothetical protein